MATQIDTKLSTNINSWFFENILSDLFILYYFCVIKLSFVFLQPNSITECHKNHVLFIRSRTCVWMFCKMPLWKHDVIWSSLVFSAERRYSHRSDRAANPSRVVGGNHANLFGKLNYRTILCHRKSRDVLCNQ